MTGTTVPDYTREDILVLVNALLDDMNTRDFLDRAAEVVKRTPVPRTDDELLERYEEVQADFFTTRFQPPATLTGAGGALDGNAILAQLRSAAPKFPDEQIEGTIEKLCVLSEAHIARLMSTVPELQHLLPSNSASTGGGALGAMSNASLGTQMMNVMDMALQSLTPEQRQVTERVQRAMMTGQPISREDNQAMVPIQQHLSAFMQTMAFFNQQQQQRQ